jgi:A/G-specific adenine glycosylase
LSVNNFTEKLINWYNVNKRDLPWRLSRDPYLIWVSEIILQQTQIKQGLPYYEKFIKVFPTVNDLANSSSDKLMNIWQGLGYYSRAQNMHKTAKIVVDTYAGKFPRKYDELIMLPGIGDYTASAISSICNNEYNVVVDGNVIRLFSRIFNLTSPNSSSSIKKDIKKIAQKLIFNSIPGDFNQAMMDYGSIVCSPKKYNCKSCIFSNDCYAYQNNIVDDLPIKKKPLKIKSRFFNYLVGISKNKKVKILKRTKNDIWQNLYEFPLVETSKIINLKRSNNAFSEIEYFNKEKLIKEVEIKHKLSHQILYIKFWLFYSDYEDQDFKEISNLGSYAFPKPLFKFISHIQ